MTLRRFYWGLPLLRWTWRFGGLALLAAWFGYGLLRIDQSTPPAPDLTVLLIQGNVAQGQKWDRALMVSIFRRYLDMTRQAVAEAGAQPKVVVWPETASPALLKNLRRESMIVPYGAAAPTLPSNAASSCDLAIQKSRRR